VAVGVDRAAGGWYFGFDGLGWNGMYPALIGIGGNSVTRNFSGHSWI
jgi:hypothetical protein